MMKPQPLDLKDIEKEILIEWFGVNNLEWVDECPKDELLKEDVYGIIQVTINKIKRRIKSACEFYLRYKDKPELLVEEYPKLLEKMIREHSLTQLIKKNIEKIKVIDGSIIAFLKDKSGLSFSKKDYNEWLFRLAFEDVLENEN